ncbi:hypothetical protein [Olivibacter sitiensis]|uniref:hypothetical protein n=1 Tax=Olivibacter sitiensis TaxID=376470 RepID=UPI000419BED9|nr:hypothetical protein [Olivibacter sitiensis]
METKLLQLFPQENGLENGPEIRLSIRPFLKRLEELRSSSSASKQKIFDFILDRFRKAEERFGPLSIDNVDKFKEEFSYASNLFISPLQDESKTFWALAFPIYPNIFFGTETFYARINTELTNQEGTDYLKKKEAKVLPQMYSLILERLYGIPAIEFENFIYSCPDDCTSLPLFFEVKIDNTFVEVSPNGDLPPLNFKQIRQNNLQEVDWRQLQELLPIEKFRFEGFSIISLVDVGVEHTVETIKDLILDSHSSTDTRDYHEMENALHILSGRKELHIKLLPLLKINGSPIYDQELVAGSVIFDKLPLGLGAQQGHELINRYLQTPVNILHEVEGLNTEPMPLLKVNLPNLDIKSYVCVPLYHYKQVVGLLEIYSMDDYIDRSQLARFRPVLSLLAQFLYDKTQLFNNQIESIIKEKFTSLKPAVEWKFMEEAWNYLKQSRIEGAKPTIRPILFKDVYPLYGAIDIRNSTIERNAAYINDLRLQLELLIETLHKLNDLLNIAIIDEITYNCEIWLQQLATEPIDNIRHRLKHFIEVETQRSLDVFKTIIPKAGEIIAHYEKETHPETGACFAQRRALESSIEMVNAAINGYLDLFNNEVQQSYPCYFEKFRTDGVEYDIYIGQSICPNKHFDHLYLKNIRLWQLSAMAAITKLTSKIVPNMPRALETTQLIFVNSSAIDISFRMDERRFDVEGAYNIRYQIVKKRIDKIRLKDSEERLTQPDKIAIVFLNEEDMNEYGSYISYLQGKKILKDDLEKVELEELQGISGLKALRVGVEL